MPFASNGVYTPPTGAENAVPGQIIASATWNTIHTDISTALTQLGEQNWTQTPRVISSPGSFTVQTTDAFIFVQASAPTITLPASSTKLFPVKIMGASGTIFSGFNSVLLPTGGDKISGESAATLTVAYQVATLFPLASGGYIISYA